MLDVFLKAAYARSEKEKQIDKVASHSSFFSTNMGRGGGGPDDWLDKFKGTPLLPKALGLLQQEIQLDQQDMATREQRDAEMESSRQLWKMRDAVCLQKRMLDLELASSELVGFPTAPPPVGMMPEPPPEAVEVAAAPEGMPETPSPKEAAMRMKMAAQLMRMKEAAGVLGLPKAVLGGMRQVGRSASKGYGKEGLKGALTQGSKRFSTIAKMSPATAAGMVAVPAAAVGAAGLGAGYMAGR